MKRSIKSLTGFILKETDGELGKVEEYYFDDQTWDIRYLIVKTGNWFSQKKVLISPTAIQKTDWEHKEFVTNLSKSQVKNSPDIDTEKPVSRQHEQQLSSYYQWDEYWQDDAHGGAIFGMMPDELYDEDESREEQPETPPQSISNYDQHLWSTSKVLGYKIHATNGEVGAVIDYIIDDVTWKIEFLVVSTGKWMNKRNILLETKWAKEVNWDNSVVIAGITTESIEGSPEYNESEGVDEAYEKKLYDHYVRVTES